MGPRAICVVVPLGPKKKEIKACGIMRDRRVVYGYTSHQQPTGRGVGTRVLCVGVPLGPMETFSSRFSRVVVVASSSFSVLRSLQKRQYEAL